MPQRVFGSVLLFKKKQPIICRTKRIGFRIRQKRYHNISMLSILLILWKKRHQIFLLKTTHHKNTHCLTVFGNIKAPSLLEPILERKSGCTESTHSQRNNRTTLYKKGAETRSKSLMLPIHGNLHAPCESSE